MSALWISLLAPAAMAQDATAEADATRVTRWLSHVANDAVLHGRWDGQYDDGAKPTQVTAVWLPAPGHAADTDHWLEVELGDGALWTLSGLSGDQVDGAKIGTWTATAGVAQLEGGQVVVLALEGAEATAAAWPSSYFPTYAAHGAWPSSYFPTYAANISWPSTYWPTAEAHGAWPSTYWPTFQAEVSLRDGSVISLTE